MSENAIAGYVVDYLVMGDVPVAVTNPDRTTHTLKGFQAVFETEHQANVFAASLGTSPAVRPIWFTGKTQPEDVK